MNDPLNGTVEVVRATDGQRVIRVVPDGPKLRYWGGQYGSLALPSDQVRGKLVKRPYSISSSIVDLDRGELIEPKRTGYYEFYFNRVDAAMLTREALTPKLFELSTGDRLWCGPKIIGNYTIEHVAPGHNVLLACTTTGEAANNSLINDLLLEGRAARICHVVIGPEDWRSLYSDEHAFLERRFASFRCVSRNVESLQEIDRWFGDLLASAEQAVACLGFALVPEQCHVFLCGDPEMIGAPKKLGAWQYEPAARGLVSVFSQRGFQMTTRFKAGNLEYEAYW